MQIEFHKDKSLFLITINGRVIGSIGKEYT